jgi:chromosome segregation ATPase|tara:strand:- start:6387 stop:6800 length:414 start_codon:yes stop_codon:yes gene_type:complete
MESIESVDTNIKLLQKEVASFQQILAKYDITIIKITDVVNKFDKVIAVQQSKIETQEKAIEIIHKRIDDMKDELHDEFNNHYHSILEEIKELQKLQNSHASKMSKRVDALEKWRYIVMGGAVALGFLLSKVPFEALF